MAVCATIGNRQTGSVVVASMALQAQRRLADREKIGVRRSMRGMAAQTVLRHWRMLVRKRPAILCVTSQAELVHVCRLQIVTRCSTVCVVAVDAAHFAFAQRMMV